MTRIETKPLIIRPPVATEYNQKEFCSAWINAYGGTYRNALRVYQVEILKNRKNGGI